MLQQQHHLDSPAGANSKLFKMAGKVSNLRALGGGLHSAASPPPFSEYLRAAAAVGGGAGGHLRHAGGGGSASPMLPVYNALEERLLPALHAAGPRPSSAPGGGSGGGGGSASGSAATGGHVAGGGGEGGHAMGGAGVAARALSSRESVFQPRKASGAPKKLWNIRVGEDPGGALIES
jgi:hypothetical protein